MDPRVGSLISELGVESKGVPFDGFDGERKWEAFTFKKDGVFPNTPVILVEGGPKSIQEARSKMAKLSSCIAVFRTGGIIARDGAGRQYNLFLKSHNRSYLTKLESGDAYNQMGAILNSSGFAGARTNMGMAMCVAKAIEAIPTHESDFDNRGVFSTHYVKNRLLGEIGADSKDTAAKVAGLDSVWDVLAALGWKVDGGGSDGTYRMDKTVTLVVTKKGADLGIKEAGSVAPSYTAVSLLNDTPWVILTNGARWRLYTSRVSASTTNYFELNTNLGREVVYRYLAAIFGAASYAGGDDGGNRPPIETVFENGRTYAQELEDDLSSRVLKADGIFLDLAKGILNHDRRRKFSQSELDSAKETALKVMYRVWFLLYAESRNLLPVDDKKYHPISLRYLSTVLDEMEREPDKPTCWRFLLTLFKGVRNGSPENNLPQYSGDLFRSNPSIDSIDAKNRFIVPFLRGLFERDGEQVDYASLGVRHLGNIYETLLEFSVKQAGKDIMLLENSDGTVTEVTTRQESTYSYKKNDLYLASKAGIASRKSSASYYTPQEIVRFLVKRGLDPMLDGREAALRDDMARYREDPGDEAVRRACMDRLLDIQVLDPAMGSGHFLVEALNQLTVWATRMLTEYQDHPLATEVAQDREDVIRYQKSKRITIDRSLLKDDTLLKRRIMKRCMFGVDINPLAVELAKLSLWLDSFAIGVPLTYMNHHLKAGDSTIGMWQSDLEDRQNQTLDDWFEKTERVGRIITEISDRSDVTMDQVQSSEDEHARYEEGMAPHRAMLDVLAASKIDGGVIPKGTRDVRGYVEHIAHLPGCALPPPREGNDGAVGKKVTELSDKYRFFHWELEMTDAFSDARRGFDLIVGNPPWDKIKSNDDEFFTPYHPVFRSLPTKTKKDEVSNTILKNPDIKKKYEEYKKTFKDKSLFYKTCKLQGVGDKDIWQVILERSFGLLADGGTISMVIPSQILSSVGSTEMRRIILDREVLSCYVFENRKKIFPIHSSYRFALLTVQNRSGSDEFPSGFYLHELRTLDKPEYEKSKISKLSKNKMRSSSPKALRIPEVTADVLNILEKIHKNRRIDSGLGDGWQVKLSSGFHKTNDADLLKTDGIGWPVYEGRNIYQFIPNYAKNEFTANSVDGLRREGKKRAYMKKHSLVHDSYRVVFRDTARSTDLRTVISSVIPPHVFTMFTLRTILIIRGDKVLTGIGYNKKISYICGILNSMSFDFVARSVVQMSVSTIMPSLPIPMPARFQDEIIELSAKILMSGKQDFDGFAESLRMENRQLSPGERIDAVARLDAMAAHAYGLGRGDYKAVVGSFKFGEDPAMLEADSVDWGGDRSAMRNFFGEVRKLVLGYYDEYAGKGVDGAVAAGTTSAPKAKRRRGGRK